MKKGTGIVRILAVKCANGQTRIKAVLRDHPRQYFNGTKYLKLGKQ